MVAEIDRVGYFEQLQEYNEERRAVSDEHLIHKSPQKITVDAEHRNLRLRTSLKFDFQTAPREGKCGDLASIKHDFQKSFNKFFESDPPKNEAVDADVLIGSAPSKTSFMNSQFNQKLHNGCSSESINSLSTSSKRYNTSPIWALDFIDNLIVIGCADGRLEFWEGTTGSFKCIYQTDSTHGNGVTHVKLASDKVSVLGFQTFREIFQSLTKIKQIRL